MKAERPVAIVGIGGVFPGARDMDQFWENILNARNLCREPPPGRWLLSQDDVWGSHPAPDRVYSMRACFVDDFRVNYDGLDIDGEYVESLDPMYGLLLHAGREAWLDSVTSHVDRERVGVIIGNIALPTETSSFLADEILLPLFETQLFGNPVENRDVTNPLNRYVTGLPAGLLARSMGLGGGSYTLDAACASSLYALRYAVAELCACRADAMLAGGLSRPDSLYTQMGFSALTALSPSGRCSPFDRKADGLVVGEGCGMVVLKRLEDALQAGDQIYAIITGIGLSNDIGGNLMSPDSEGQLRAMRSAYQRAGWQPRTVDLMECHGTGTPVGDMTEYNSLRELWGEHADAGACVLGSVKSNIGHLLTAAGSAGLLKVLLAMKYRVLPPTANYESFPETVDMDKSAFVVLKEPREWADRKPGQPRRAAVSAFGFGGINAHVLLQEWTGDKNNYFLPAPKNLQTGDIAVIGMDASFGPWRTLEDFTARVLDPGDVMSPGIPSGWWGKEIAKNFRGYFIDEVEIPVGRFRIPPSELRNMLPQQLLMLQVAANAIADAGIDADHDMINTGVYIGIGLDLNTTNFHLRWKLLPESRKWLSRLGIDMNGDEFQKWVAELRDAAGPPLNADRTMGSLGGIVASRIARAFNAGGPSFTVSNEEVSGLRAVEMGIRALRHHEIDLAVTGAVDLAGDIRAVLGQDSARGYAGDQIPGEGAAAIVLKRYSDARRDGDRVYALIKGMGDATGGVAREAVPSAEAYRLAASRCREDAGTSIDSIGYIELHGSGYKEEDEMESQAVMDMLMDHAGEIPVETGDSKTAIGHTGAAGGLAAIVKTCLCLYHTVLPALPDKLPPGPTMQGAVTLHAPLIWLRNRKDGPRRAMINSMSVDGNCISAILEGDENRVRTGGINKNNTPELFTVSGHDKKDLKEQLRQLDTQAGQNMDFHRLAADWWCDRRMALHDCRHTISLVASSAEELQYFVREATDTIMEDKPVAGKNLFYNPSPLGPSAKVAFVFPGSGNHFTGMGREAALFRPDIMDRLDQENDYLAGQFAGISFWRQQPGVSALTHVDMIFGQVWLGTLMSDIVTGFGIKPSAVIGYSLGETAGLFATRTWTDRDLMLNRIRASTLFTSDLAGPCNAVRETWGLAPGEAIDWQVGMVDRSAAEVTKVVEAYPRVYLLIVNTRDECVIGGDRPAVHKVVEDLSCNFHPVEGVTTVHCEVVRPVEQAYRKLHLFRTCPPPGIAFYSGIRGGPYEVTDASAADSITGQALQHFDYTKVINRAWDDGVRVFIELGPGGTCTRMIDRILGDKVHVARALCVKGQSEVRSIIRLLAQLHAEGMHVDLSYLYANKPKQDPYADHQKIIIPVGKKSLTVPLPWNKLKVESEKLKIFDPPAPRPSPRVTDLIPSDEGNMLAEIIRQSEITETVQAETQAQFLKVANSFNEIIGELQTIQLSLLQSMPPGTLETTVHAANHESNSTSLEPRVPSHEPHTERPGPRIPSNEIQGTGLTPLAPRPSPLLTRDQCLEFATGSITEVLGPLFSEADSLPTRVRLPGEPLMLVDRIIDVEGEPGSMTCGRVITEHDILPGVWYLDCGRIPTCIAVEAGQADLFLSAYLGIDLQTKGLAMYRLLDAEVTFHDSLPEPGQTIHYDIHIDHFFRQGSTWLFRFHFDGTIEGHPLISMSNGCAGFFSGAELDAGQGIVLTSMEQQSHTGNRPHDWTNPVTMRKETYSDAQIDALRSGQLAECFGREFDEVQLRDPVSLPSGRMTLVHRVLSLDPAGGRFNIGQITGEADIHPDDWFLTCHFVDDQVMPGTLMYECCLHTLRIYLLRMGWVGEAGEFVYEPVAGITSKLKCRGQVTAATRQVQYEITLKEYGYQPDGTPYVIADALMYADHRPIVQMLNMSLRLSGLSRQRIEKIWQGRRSVSVNVTRRKPIFDHDSILAFAVGKPSEAFGERYRVFDGERIIARLPGPPFQFLDRIVTIRDCRQWELKSGGFIEAEYDVPENAWYFSANRQPFMPYSVLLEVALQPCGWLAAYLGSALTSEEDLSFRNLGGEGIQYSMVTPDSGTLRTAVRITDVSRSGGMIIQHFDFHVRGREGDVYRGSTYFGFFTRQALTNQVGVRDVQPYSRPPQDFPPPMPSAYPDHAPYPDAMFQMIDEIKWFDLRGGSDRIGFLEGTTLVNPDAWFFKAHFYQDPVWPGSLGLESLIQLMKVSAVHHYGSRTGNANPVFESMGIGDKHSWVYRGQILPIDKQVGVQAIVTGLDREHKALKADGILSVDGRIIYQMTGFTLKINPDVA